MAEDWLAAFQPHADDLLDLLLPQVDESMLLEIAAADYGQEVERHLTPLKLFRDQRVIPVLSWHPGEVLELIRWSEPDEQDWKPGDNGLRGHLLRAFACSTLLRARERQDNDTYDSFGDTTIQLERSLHALGAAFIRPGARFFAWCVERLSAVEAVGDEKLFFGLALLSLTIKLPQVQDDALVGLCKWVDASIPIDLRCEPEWLPFDLRGQKFSRWVQMGNELCEWAQAQPRSDGSAWVELIGQSLADK